MSVSRNTVLVTLLFAATFLLRCAQTTNSTLLRSLERSASVAFVCANAPSASPPGLPADYCHAISSAPTSREYPHMLALVTQQARGEVAVVDVTNGRVLDQNAAIPGYNFIPVGQAPTDIVATPSSTASFVSVADPVRPGLFALPTAWLLPNSFPGGPKLTSFPSCRLPALPGRMVVVNDPLVPAGETLRRRAECGGEYGSQPADASEAGTPVEASRSLAPEWPLYGTPKLVVALPDLGELAVVDAQKLLSSAPGQFDSCPIEAYVSLRDSPEKPGLSPRPSQLALSDDGRLYVADENAPIVHVLDARSPCSITELEPLRTTSSADPKRVAVTSGVAVSPLTSDGKRFVYAIDLKDAGSIMVFDVSPGATSTTPLTLKNPVYAPTGSPDRLQLGSPVQAVSFVRNEFALPTGDPNTTGTVPIAACDPTDPSDPFRPPTDYTSTGAGPARLRGIFALAVLSNGYVAILDVDDLDAPCRRARSTDPRLGCPESPDGPLPSASDEASCNVVVRHQVRSARYLVNAPQYQIYRAPAMQTVPLLTGPTGSVLSVDPASPDGDRRPRMLGPSLESASDPTLKPYVAQVAGATGQAFVASPYAFPNDADPSAQVATSNWLAFDLREPRVHSDQRWDVTYEGALPGFGDHLGSFRCRGADRSSPTQPDDCEFRGDGSAYDFYDSSAAFCSLGVQGADLVPEAVRALSPAVAGDIVEVTESIPLVDDPYWATVSDQCTYQRCLLGYGTPQAPVGAARDRTVARAFQDHLELLPAREAPGDSFGPLPLRCCFPYPVRYRVRTGGQWTVTGTVSGFAHRVEPDPAFEPQAAPCRLSPDPKLRLRNGRAYTVAPPQGREPPAYDAVSDPRLFANAQIQLVVYGPIASPCEACIQRDMKFSVTESGGFQGLVRQLSATSLVLPQSIQYVPGIRRVAIPDAMSTGLLMFSLDTLSVIESYY